MMHSALRSFPSRMLLAPARFARRSSSLKAVLANQMDDKRAALVDLKKKYGAEWSLVTGSGSGIGWAIAIAALAAIREKLRYSHVPDPLRGLGITFIVVGLMSVGFMAFSGIQL